MGGEQKVIIIAKTCNYGKSSLFLNPKVILNEVTRILRNNSLLHINERGLKCPTSAIPVILLGA